MTTAPTIEERLAALEKTVSELAIERTERSVATTGWRSTIGMFDDDPGFPDFIEECKKIRAADRRAALEE